MVYQNLTPDEITQLKAQAGDMATKLIDKILSEKLGIQADVSDNGKILQVGADGKIVPMASSEGLTIDDTLTTENAAADAKAVGDIVFSHASKITAVENMTAAQALILTKTAADVVEIDDAAEAVVRSLDIAIEPVQSGTGDVSPTNVRAISGWEGATLIVSPTQSSDDGTEYEFEFPDAAGTVYGGNIHIAADGTVTLTVDRVAETLDEDTEWTKFEDGKFFASVTEKAAYGAAIRDKYISNQYPFAGNGDTSSANIVSDKHFYGQATTTLKRIWVYDSSYTTVDALKAALETTPLVVVYPLATPATYTLTSTEVALARLVNNLWADTGKTAVEYNGDLKTYIDNLPGGQSAANTLSMSPLSMGAMQLGNTLSPAVEEPETTESEQE